MPSLESMPEAPDHVSREHICFGEAAAPDEWDETVYAPGTYETFLWSFERESLLSFASQLARRKPALRYLDFACGTGRALAVVAPLSSSASGVDISSQMLKRAAAKVPDATLIAGDILANDDLAAEGYDLITAFRFFLNADPDVRLQVMRALASRLRDDDSYLVFNIHSNSLSLGGLASLAGRRKHLSIPAVRTLVKAAGLRIEAYSGFGVAPGSRSRLRALRPGMRAIDRWAAEHQRLKAISRDLMFFCRPA